VRVDDKVGIGAEVLDCASTMYCRVAQWTMRVCGGTPCVGSVLGWHGLGGWSDDEFRMSAEERLAGSSFTSTVQR
jgi:hypothetical protein